MALYDYTCKACGNKSEHLMFSDSEEPACPSCGSDMMERELSSFAVSVKSGRSSSAPSCPTGGCCGGTCGM